MKVTGNVLLSHTGLPCSTIGAVRLNFRVRDGIGCSPYAIVTGKSLNKIYFHITISLIQANHILKNNDLLKSHNQLVSLD